MAHYAPKTNNGVPEKKIQKVVKGEIGTKKKTGFSKFADVFLAEDIASVRNYVFTDLIVPRIKETAVDIFESFVMGKRTGHRRSSSGGTTSISYQKFYEKPSHKASVIDTVSRSVYAYETITFTDARDATEVLEALEAALEEYNSVSVADFYSAIGQKANATDTKYGWESLSGARVRCLGPNSYTIEFPKARPID